MNRRLLLVVFLFSGLAGWAQQIPARDGNGIALEGYDAVSYFQGGPEKGLQKHSYTYQGSTYLFSSDYNRTAFVQHPDKYLPQYGGWCAYAMGLNGSLVPVNPETYKILNGRLYLFYNAGFNNTLKKWNRKEAALLPRADRQWETYDTSKNQGHP